MQQLSAPVAATLVYCDGKEPTFQTALTTEPLETEIGCEEDFLANIFDFTGPAEQTIGERPHVSRV